MNISILKSSPLTVFSALSIFFLVKCFHLKLNLTTLSSNLIYCNIIYSTDLSVAAGKLVAVVGSVGSGKSSLVSAILGDMEVLSGNIHVRVNHRTYKSISIFQSDHFSEYLT